MFFHRPSTIHAVVVVVIVVLVVVVVVFVSVVDIVVAVVVFDALSMLTMASLSAALFLPFYRLFFINIHAETVGDLQRFPICCDAFSTPSGLGSSLFSKAVATAVLFFLGGGGNDRRLSFLFSSFF